jgi:hypothetical protein
MASSWSPYERGRDYRDRRALPVGRDGPLVLVYPAESSWHAWRLSVTAGDTRRELAHLGSGGVVTRPRLFERLGVARVSVVSAPAGSAKTVLLRSWIGHAGLTGGAAWVPVGRGEGDPGSC